MRWTSSEENISYSVSLKPNKSFEMHPNSYEHQTDSSGNLNNQSLDQQSSVYNHDESFSDEPKGEMCGQEVSSSGYQMENMLGEVFERFGAMGLDKEIYDEEKSSSSCNTQDLTFVKQKKANKNKVKVQDHQTDGGMANNFHFSRLIQIPKNLPKIELAGHAEQEIKCLPVTWRQNENKFILKVNFTSVLNGFDDVQENVKVSKESVTMEFLRVIFVNDTEEKYLLVKYPTIHLNFSVIPSKTVVTKGAKDYTIKLEKLRPSVIRNPFDASIRFHWLKADLSRLSVNQDETDGIERINRAQPMFNTNSLPFPDLKLEERGVLESDNDFGLEDNMFEKIEDDTDGDFNAGEKDLLF